MSTFNNQGKNHQVAATQESTAQNSANQSKAFGLFTDYELGNIVKNSGSEFVQPSFLINYLHQAEKILDRARMSDENRDFIKNAFSMLCAFGNWDTMDHYEFIYQSETPDSIRERLESGDDREIIADDVDYELGCICSDLDSEDYYFDDYEVECAVNALREFMDIVNEYNLDIPRNSYDYVYEVMGRYNQEG